MAPKRKTTPENLDSVPLTKRERILHEHLNGRIIGGRLSELAMYSDLFFKMTDPILLIHRETQVILECNPAAETLLDSTEDAILGSHVKDWLASSEQQKELSEYFQSASKSKKAIAPKDFNFVNRRKEEIIFEILACPLKLGNYSEVVQIIAKDVTDVRRARRALEEMNAMLSRLSTTDEMTGLKNYRSFKEELAKVHDYCSANEKKYSVVFIDVDHFKKYNDRNGHPAGDAVLRKVGEILRKGTRIQDLPARYGGEEFVVLMPDTGREDAFKNAQKILDIMRAEKFPYGEHQPLGLVSASLGVATFPVDGTTAAAILENADNAVYASKNNGRNQVTMFVPNITTIKKAA